MHRHVMTRLVSATLMLSVGALATQAATYKWMNPDGSATNEYYWGLDKNWDQGADGNNITTDGIPNSNVDSVSFDGGFMSSSKRILQLANASGVDTSYTIKSWSQSSSSSGNRGYTVNNVTGGSAKLIFAADTGNASVSVSTNTGNPSTFNAGITLMSDLDVKVSGNAGNDTKVNMNGSIGENGGARVLNIFGNGSNAGYRVNINNANTYSGGTFIGGVTANTNNIDVRLGASANLGTGNVTVYGGKLSLVNTAGSIANNATLRIDTGGTVDLGVGVNDIIGGLTLGGITQTTGGTYGAVGSGATFTSALFTGTGVVTLVIPEPASLALLGLGGLLMLPRRKRMA